MFKYETHLHTLPVSACAQFDVETNLTFYKDLGYDGVFITNHFLDGNLNYDRNTPYEERINFYFSDYEKGLELVDKIGIKVFCGIEMSYKGTDFLVYGLDKEWFLAHPEIMDMKKRDELTLMAESGALIIQAHPYREAAYIDHIRLFPRNVHGIEVINGNRTELENKMAEIYAENYGLIPFAGSDNHSCAKQKKLAGVSFKEPIKNVEEFIQKVKNREMEIFTLLNEN